MLLMLLGAVDNSNRKLKLNGVVVVGCRLHAGGQANGSILKFISIKISLMLLVFDVLKSSE